MQQRKLGNLTLGRVHELIQPFPTREFFPDTTPEDWAPHEQWLIDEGALTPDGANIILPMQSYIVRTSHHNILVDTCVGNHKERPNRLSWHQKTDSTYLDNLRAHGLGVEDIDIVMCTHLHHDHVGWNTRLENGCWVPTFPNARYLISRKELDVFTSVEDPAAQPSLDDSVLPIVESGQAELITSDYQLDDEVFLEPTPGHTPDHFAVRLKSGSHHGVIAGDLMHSPVQCLHPEWRPRPDFDPAQARATRERFMAEHAELQSLVCMMHFPLPSAGHFQMQENGFRFIYDRIDW